MAVMNSVAVLHYRRRADSFLRAAGDLEILERDAHAPAIGLLSVHGCIALADAVIVALSGRRTAADDHHEAARTLRTLTRSPHGVGWAGLRRVCRRLGRSRLLPVGQVPG